MLLSDVVELIHYRGSAFETQHIMKHPADSLHLLVACLLFGVFIIAVVTEKSMRYTERLEIDLCNSEAPQAK